MLIQTLAGAAGALVFGFTVFSASTQDLLVQEGMILRQTQTTPGAFGGKGFSINSTVYLGNHATKIAFEGGNEIIAEVDQRRVRILDHSRKTYSEVTADQWKKVLDAGLAEFDAGENARDLQRAAGKKPAAVRFTRKGDGGVIAGHKTDKYILQGRVEIQLWIAPDLEAPQGYYEALKLTTPANPYVDMDQVYDALREIGGMVLQRTITIKVKDKPVATTNVVTSVERKPLPVSTFEVPSDYRPVAPPF